MDEVGERAPARAPARARARPRKLKRARWSAKRERAFLETLAGTANIAASARAAGLSESTMYRRRQRDEAFRGRWLDALREGFVLLETTLLDRALNGVEKPVWHGGKQVGTAREYSDRLALALLNAHRATVAGPGAAEVPLTEEAMDAEVLRRLGEMSRRMAE